NVSGEGMAHLGLYDQQGIERAALVVTKEGTTMFAMSGDDGKPRLAANVAIHDGPAAFTLLNPDSTTAAELSMRKGTRSLQLADAGYIGVPAASGISLDPSAPRLDHQPIVKLRGWREQ